jgi:hypothetical protein
MPRWKRSSRIYAFCSSTYCSRISVCIKLFSTRRKRREFVQNIMFIMKLNTKVMLCTFHIFAALVFARAGTVVLKKDFKHAMD